MHIAMTLHNSVHKIWLPIDMYTDCHKLCMYNLIDHANQPNLRIWNTRRAYAIHQKLIIVIEDGEESTTKPA